MDFVLVKAARAVPPARRQRVAGDVVSLCLALRIDLGACGDVPREQPRYACPALCSWGRHR